MLIHLRIDDRLIHGQVTVSWSKHVGAQRIVVANDEVAKDEIQKSLLPLAAPPGVEVTISSIEKANKHLEDNKKTFLLVKNPYDALRLLEDGVEIKEINLGNMGYSEGKKPLERPCL
jgi:Phosphotransferase system, mannose/fructose/N-acetylgalactosamine-specific component IIB